MELVGLLKTLISNFREISFDAKIFSSNAQMRAGISRLLLFLLLILPAVVNSDQCTTNSFTRPTTARLPNSAITITGYTGSGGAVIIPSTTLAAGHRHRGRGFPADIRHNQRLDPRQCHQHRRVGAFYFCSTLGGVRLVSALSVLEIMLSNPALAWATSRWAVAHRTATPRSISSPA